MFCKVNKFTLIELIVVIAVLGILSSIVIPNIKDIRSKAEIAAVESNTRNIQTAVDVFFVENGYYPVDIQPDFIIEGESKKTTLQKINFYSKDLSGKFFVSKYLREEPDTTAIFKVDSYGKVSTSEVNSKEVSEIYGRGLSNFMKMSNGDIYGWGINNYGQIGVDSE